MCDMKFSNLRREKEVETACEERERERDAGRGTSE